MKPDAALLAMNSPCFPVSPQAPKPIRTADNPFIELLLVYHGVVGMIFPASVMARWRVISRGIAFEYDGVVNRFPHLVVTQASYWFFFMKFPLFRKQFSFQGDSGSWVTEQKTGTGVGMVTAGVDGVDISYVAEAEPLQHYFSELLTINLKPQSF
jgi:hypothetical protein